ncbi:MAG TPA: 30S ribosomal protein S17 [Pyrinomonadaceae bacterium]|nr:30S ribosomal protein S17 [Pyrinomonadaceae bacterium]
MPRKKKDELEETQAAAVETDETRADAVEASTAETAEARGDDAAAAGAGGGASKKEKKATKTEGESAAAGDEPSFVDSVIEAAADVVETVAETVGKGAADLVSAIAGAPAADTKVRQSKRAEKIGIVSSDKMTRTVTVRVDRLVKHPIYRKYVRKRKKFMAHDETGAKIGDKVRIVETRPLSARKRWRVVEIIQKAEL